MKIDVEALKNAPGKPFTYTFALDFQDYPDADDEVIPDSLLAVDLQAEYRESAIVISGTMRAQVTFTCSRCLRTFSCSFQEEFEDEIEPGEETELDLAELAREIYSTAIPLKPLCSEDCLGLCGVCGADLNDKRCGCPVEETDSRLAVLKKLLE